MNIRANYSRHYNQRQELARLGEESAADYLSKQGYTMVARNWRAGLWGEIDLIAYGPNGILVFVEVKTRILANGSKNGIYPLGFEAINRSKQAKIIRSAWRFQQVNNLKASVRFDAIVVIYRISQIYACYDRDSGNSSPEIIHVPNAFAPA